MTTLRTNIVTGARSGMGKATAALLRERGERVVGIDLADCEIAADLSDPSGRAWAVDEVRRLCPEGIDTAIACAGVTNEDGVLVVSVNYFGVVGMLRGLAPMLRLDRAPRAVAISSQACMYPGDADLTRFCLEDDEPSARARGKDVDGLAVAYFSSKLALSLWIRRNAAQADWAGRGVLLNAVAPGQVLTPMIAPRLETPEGAAGYAQFSPFATPNRAGPEDLALTIAFLASPDNRYMAGQTIFCDGGAEVTLRADRNTL